MTSDLLHLDIDAAFERGIVSQNDDRGDEGAAHIGGDVAGLCDREGWARRRSALGGAYPQLLARFDATTKTMFQLGHAAEKMLLDGIEDGLPLGWRMDRNVEVGLSIAGDGELAAVGSYHEWLVDGSGEVARGHIDALLAGPDGERIVVDTKSTVWWNRNEGGKQIWYPKGNAKHSHVLQVAAYALAANASAAVLYELDLGGKARRTTYVDPEEHREEITRRVAEVLERTDPAKPMPPAEPNDWAAAWACGSVQERFDKKTGEMITVVKRSYCRFTSCPMNVNSHEVTL